MGSLTVSRTTSDDSEDDLITQIHIETLCYRKMRTIAFFVVYFLRILVVSAALYYFSDPCNPLLKWYVIPTNNLHFCFKANNAFFENSLFTSWEGRRVSLFLDIMGLCVLYTCRACQKSNPFLHVAAFCWVMADIIAVFLLLLYVVFLVCCCRSSGSYRLVHTDFLTDEFTGCVDAVSQLQKVPAGSSELIDPEDGSMLQCTICSEPLDGPQTVVRTLCSHFFHEECLEQWCSHHLDCPLCRRHIEGGMDPS